MFGHEVERSGRATNATCEIFANPIRKLRPRTQCFCA